MKIPLITSILATLLLFCGGCATQGDVATLPTGNGLTVRIQWMTPSIVRVTKYPAGQEPSLSPSRSIVLAPEKVSFRRQYGKDSTVTLSSGKLVVRVDLKDGSVQAIRPDGTGLIEERHESTTFEPFDDAGRSTWSVSQSFVLDGDEAIYGLGSHRDGGLDQRGRSWHLENSNMEMAVPVVHSVKGYALYWDNYSPTGFSESEGTMSFRSMTADMVDYYLVAAENADGVIAGLRQLSGQAPMSPLWSYGFLQSKERYRSQEELVETVRKYREIGVPLDGIIQDWQYWGDNAHWNACAFLNHRYNDPVGMMEQIHGMNAHSLISVWPSFGPETDIHKELDGKGLLMDFTTYPQDPGVRVYSPWSEEAREIYWKHLSRDILSKGMDGWWLDATEPEHKHPAPEEYDYLSPEGTYRKMRNSFPLYSVGGVYDHQRAETDSRRVLILTRSATLGMQRYGAHSWSGDVVSSWEVLRYQIGSALNYTMSGLPYWNSDIGGFFSAPMYPEGTDDPAFRHLYCRWAQLGAFSGMMRSHGTNTPREIYRFGERGDKDFDAIEQAIRLRYALLPYIYSQAARITSEGASLMRPLFMDFPEDRKTWNLEDEFLFGDNLLVAPVCQEDNAREVYLPAGGWTDFWSGETAPAGPFEMDVPEDMVPVFVRPGTILPLGPDVEYASEKPWDDIQVRIYPGADGSFTLYEDEGDGYGYERGLCARITFNWDDATRTLSVDKRKGSFPGMAEEKTFRIVIVRPDNGSGLNRKAEDATLSYRGKAISVTL